MNSTQFKHLALSTALLTLVGCASAPKSSDFVNQPSPESANAVGNANLGDTIQLPAENSLGMDVVVVDRTYFAASGLECRHLRDVDGVPIQRVACKRADGQWRFSRDLTPISAVQVQSRTAVLPLIPSAGSALLLDDDSSVSDNALLNESVDSVLIGDNIVTESTTLLGTESNYSDTTTVADTTNFVDSSSYNNAELGAEVFTDESVDKIQRKLQSNETLWAFAKRTTGNALNWKSIAELNNITDAKTLAPGAQLTIPVALVREGG